MKKKIHIILSICIVAVLGIGAILAFSGFFKKTEQVGPTGNIANIEWYDEDAEEFTLTSADMLYEFAELSYFYDFKGQTVKLGADIVVNEGNATEWGDKAPKRKWFAINKFAGTFDGQGHTISGLYMKVTDTNVGVFSGTTEGTIIRDFRLVNSYFEATGRNNGVASICGYGSGTFEKIYSDAIMKAWGTHWIYAGGIVGNLNGNSTISECWFAGSVETDARASGGIVAGATAGKSTIEHCLNTGSIDSTYTKGSPREAGICGFALKGSKLDILDCLNTGTITCSTNNVQVGSVLGLVDNGSDVVMKDTYASTESYVVAVHSVFDEGTLDGGAIQINEEQLKGYGGYEWTTLDFDKYWAVVTDDTPILQCFATEVPSLEGVAKKFSLDWYSEDATEYEIKTKEELFGFAMMSKLTDFKKKTVKLSANVAVNEGKAANWNKKAPEYVWLKIGDSTLPFAGTFDGQGHTISGIYVKGEQYVGLFARTALTSVIKNLKLKNSYFESTFTEESHLGSISGRGGGTFDTIYSDAIIVSTGRMNGGIIGQVNAVGDNTITNCWYDGKLQLKDTTGRHSGGIAGGVVLGETVISHCLNTGTVSCEKEDGGSNIGGICGVTMNADTKLLITDCLNVGQMVFKNIYANGSILGNVAGGEVTIRSTYATKESCVVNNSPKTVGNVYGTLLGEGVDYLAKDLTGYSAYQRSDLDFKNYWAVSENGTPVLRSFANRAPSVSGIAKLYDISWYNEKATTYVIDSKEDLLGLYIISAQTDFAGKTVKLGKDIVVNEGVASEWGENAPSISWYPTKLFAGTFDGQGYTISGLYVNSEYNLIGMFSKTKETSKIQNFKLVNSYFESRTHEFPQVGSIVGLGEGTFDSIYSNAIVKSEGKYSGGLVGRSELQATFTNCWFDGDITIDTQFTGGICGITDGGKLIIEHCLNTGNITSKIKGKYAQAGGMCGAVMLGGELVINDCFGAGNFTVNDGGAGTILGHAIKGSVKIRNTHAVGIKPIGHTQVEIDGGAIHNAISSVIGYNAFLNTSLDYKTYWAARIDDAPILKRFMSGNVLDSTGALSIDTSWYTKDGGTKDNPYLIADASDLYGLSSLSSETNFAGKYIKLTNDIVINTGDAADWITSAPNYVWTPIGQALSFAGTFDGQGHTISGLYLNSNANRLGLFGQTTTAATIKNFKLTNSCIISTENGFPQIGSIVGTGHGTFDTIYSDAIVKSDGDYCGGMIGRMEADAKITNCWFAGHVTSAGRFAGGIFGAIEAGNLTIQHCLNSGTVTSIFTSGWAGAGGIGGVVQSKAGTLCKVEDSLNIGIIRVNNPQGAGSVLGRARSPLQLSNVYTTNDVAHSDGQTKIQTQNTVDGVGNYSTNGNTVTGKAVILTMSELLGVNAYNNTNLDFEEYWAARQDTTPGLISFVPESDRMDLSNVMKVSTAWYGKTAGTKVDPYLISNKEELYGLAQLSQTNDFAGKYIKLTADIVINEGNASDWATNAPEYNWTPIGRTTPFAGTFDGSGKTISGLYLSSNTNLLGLFGKTTTASNIKNFRLTNSYLVCSGHGYPHIGSIAGVGNGTFGTIYSDAILQVGGELGGGLIGLIEGDTTITNCWFAGSITTTSRYVGGIFGQINAGKLTMKNCLVTGNVTSTYSGGWAAAGGIGGRINTSGKSLIEDCLVTGAVRVSHAEAAGSVFGRVLTSTEMVDVYTTNDVKHSNGTTAIKTNNTVDGCGNYSSNVTGKATYVQRDLLLGEAAKTNASGLDYTNAWITVDQGTPILKKIEEIGLDSGDSTDWYDEAAGTKEDPYLISNMEELYGLATLSQSNDFAGKYIKLTDDIVINEGNASDWASNAPEYNWTPIGQTTPFAGTFDGNGKTISGLYLNSTGRILGLFGRTTTTATIKNFRLTNSYLVCAGDGYPHIGSISGIGKGTFDTIYSDAILKISGELSGGLIGLIEGDTTITNCWFAGSVTTTSRYAGGIFGQINAGTLTMKNCLVTGNVTSTYSGGWAAAGGIGGRINTSGASLIEDCLVIGAVRVSHAEAAGSVFGRVLTSTEMVDVYTTNDVKHSNGTTAIKTNNTVDGCGNYSSNVTGKATYVQRDSLLGDAAKTNASGLDYTNSWVTVNAGTPVLKAITEVSNVIEVSTAWLTKTAGTKEDPYLISNAGELYGLAQLSASNNFAGKYIKLTADIVINQGNASDWATNAPKYNWTPIGQTNAFAGTFDGNGKTISGLYLSSTTNLLGLFGTTNAATIKNFRLTNSCLISTEHGFPQIGGVVGMGSGTFDTIYSDAIMKAAGNYCGGLIGRIDGNTTITNCWFAGSITSSGRDAGGMFGAFEAGNLTMKNCLNTGSITSTYSSGWAGAGGLGGLVSSAAGTLCQVEDCLTVGAVRVSHAEAAGSVFGRARSPLQFIDVYTTDDVAHSDGQTAIAKQSTVDGLGNYSTNGNTVTGKATIVQRDLLVGEAAKTNASGLDFTQSWITVQDSTPILKSFKEEE